MSKFDSFFENALRKQPFIFSLACFSFLYLFLLSYCYLLTFWSSLKNV